MSKNWTRLYVPTVLVFACLALGCGSKVEEPEEPPVPMEEAEAGAVFPAILHDKMIRAQGYAWRIHRDDVLDVELLERTEDPSTGNQTAVLWFKTQTNNQSFKVKVRVVYKRLTNQTDAGFEVFSYPVSELKVVESERIDG